MNLTEKHDLYRSKFPKQLADRMCQQMDERAYPAPDDPGSVFVEFFRQDYRKTNEGQDFWYSIRDLYHDCSYPTDSQIQEVFQRHGIEYA